MRARIFLVLAFVFVLGAPTAHATTLTFDALSNPSGATADVAGAHIYDVVRVKTTCIAEFSGCDEDGDFAPITFGTVTEAGDAVASFLDAVLATGRSAADVFGCIGTTAMCRVNAPGYAHGTGAVYGGVDASFYSTWAGRFFQQINPTDDSALDDTLVYARLSMVGTAPIREPSTALLACTGLLGLAWSGRRRGGCGSKLQAAFWRTRRGG